ncbi:MAG: T9SS type A sorting domain-containing protein [Saprospiraceae bacterium]
MKKILTFLSFLCSGLLLQAQNIIKITDNDLQGNSTYNWTADNVYQLDGFVFLEEGGILNIEAGTFIQGIESPSTSDNASALIITRGAKINALGTADDPIVFTAEIDDLDDPIDLTVNDRGFWGGLIILGYGQLANATAETAVEGIPEGEDRALFGGDNDADNSGILQYVSIRHGGAELSPGNEINGLTLGAVGSETIIENIEVIANDDDGIEFFGGAVNVKYAAVSFCADDQFDWDLGWRGNGQFWMTLLGDDDGDNGGELDGAKPDDGTPTSNPTIYNATFIGAGCGTTAKNATGLLFRDGSAGTIANSVITDFNFGIEVEDRASGVDSRQRMEAGDLVLTNNVWWNFCNGSELNAGANGFVRATEDAEDATAQFLLNHLAANRNLIQDPQFILTRTDDGTFNPLGEDLNTDRTAHIDEYPADTFFTPVCFTGAFGQDAVWIQNWTALATYGVLNPNLAFGLPTASSSCETTSTEEIIIHAKGYSLIQNNPNPTTTTTQIEFTLAKRKNISLTIFDYTGKEITRLIDNAIYPPGLNAVRLDVSKLANGVYFYTLSNEEIVLTKQLVVLK